MEYCKYINDIIDVTPSVDGCEAANDKNMGKYDS